MAQIPEHIIDEIRQASDVVDIVGQYLPLKKMGNTYKTLCPFHQEKTPSFNVNPQKQIWHCFGCGKGGNVYTFLMEYDKVSFVEAVRTLAQKAGIKVPETRADYKDGRHDLLYQANELAASFFSENLADPKNASAREYLEKLGITKETQELFRLGYAPNEWDGFIKYAGRSGLSLPLLQESGLIVARETGSGFYDRFRHRIIFPFFSLGGRVIGFGGRSLEQSPQAKYLNSPETPIYHKGRGFYGFNQTKSAVGDAGYAILVEGNFDLIVPFQAGFKNILATAGTALTPDQARLLSRYARRVVVCYDPDSAGQSATERAIEPLLEAGLDVKAALLPPNMDPDAFIREKGAEEFGALIKNAITFVEFLVMRTSLQKDLSQISEKSKLVNDLAGLMVKVEDTVSRAQYARETADLCGVDESLVLDLMRKKQGLSPKQAAAPGKELPQIDWEHEIFVLLIKRPQFLEEFGPQLKEGNLPSPWLQGMLARLETQYSQSGRIEGAKLFEDLVDQEEQNRLSAIIARSHQGDDTMDDADKDRTVLRDYLKKLKELRLKPRMKELQEQIKLSEKAGNREQVSQLLAQYQELRQIYAGKKP
ncbi:DNA primase [candidate division TA06 bacterium]|nr:DNA primase [candidate division TA06 bacterium]